MSSALVEHRSRFPVLRERSYFASQCLGPFPHAALEDLEEYRSTLLMRNRSLEIWLGRMYELISLIETFLHAPPGSVALRDSATACQAAIAAAIEAKPERDRIVYSPALDFRSSRYLWTQQALRGFRLESVGRERAWLSADEICAAIDERVAIVALPLVSPQTGALLPLAEITQHARRVGAITVVDAFQAVGIVGVDVEALGADVVVGGTYKWMCGGGIGVAFMYVRPGVADRLEPIYPGWIGHANLLASTSRFEAAPGALRFQQGTPAMEPIYTSRAGLQFLMEVGIDAIRERSLVLTQRMMDRLGERGLRISTPTQPERRSGMLCLDVPGPDAIVDALALESIDIDARSDSGLRVGPFPCMDESECDHLADRIAELVAQ